MKVFNAIHKTSAEALKNGEQFYKTSFDFYRLKIFQQLTITLSMFFKLLIIGGLVFLGLIFLTIAGAIALGNMLNSMILGCIIIGVLLLVIRVIVYWQRKAINKKVTNITCKCVRILVRILVFSYLEIPVKFVPILLSWKWLDTLLNQVFRY